MPCRTVACPWQRTLLGYIYSCIKFLFALKYLYQVPKFCLSFVKFCIKCKSWDCSISVPALDTRAGFTLHFILSPILFVVFICSFSSLVYIFEVIYFCSLISFYLSFCSMSEWLRALNASLIERKCWKKHHGGTEKVIAEPSNILTSWFFPFCFSLNFKITLSCKFYPFLV